MHLVLGSQLWPLKLCLFPEQVHRGLAWRGVASQSQQRGSLLPRCSVRWQPGEMAALVTVCRPPNSITTKVGFVLSQPEAIAVFQLLFLHDRHTWWAVL